MSIAAGEDFPAIPHTFVTYEIETALRGEVPGETLTLRFLGGFSPETGRVLMAPGARYFAEGDRDLLLVAQNGRHACPLVDCVAGRFRSSTGGSGAISGLPFAKGMAGLPWGRT